MKNRSCELHRPFTRAQLRCIHARCATTPSGRARTSTEALQGDSPDFQAYENALSHAADRMVRDQAAMARAAVRARAVLTPEQRERLRTGMGMVRKMMAWSGIDGGTMRGRRMP